MGQDGSWGFHSSQSGSLFLPWWTRAQTTLPVMLPARAAGLHLGGGVHIPGIAAVTKESAAARSAPPEGRASHGWGPRGSVLGSCRAQGTGRNRPLRGTFPSSPGGSSSSWSWNSLEAVVCEGHRPCVPDVSDDSIMPVLRPHSHARDTGRGCA